MSEMKFSILFLIWSFLVFTTCSSLFSFSHHPPVHFRLWAGKDFLYRISCIYFSSVYSSLFISNKFPYPEEELEAVKNNMLRHRICELGISERQYSLKLNTIRFKAHIVLKNLLFCFCLLKQLKQFRFAISNLQHSSSTISIFVSCWFNSTSLVSVFTNFGEQSFQGVIVVDSRNCSIHAFTLLFANMMYLGAQGRMRFIMTTVEFNCSDCGCYMISFIQSSLSKFDTEVNTSKRTRCLRENGLSGW